MRLERAKSDATVAPLEASGIIRRQDWVNELVPPGDPSAAQNVP